MTISKSTCLLLYTAVGGCYYCLEISEEMGLKSQDI